MPQGIWRRFYRIHGPASVVGHFLPAYVFSNVDPQVDGHLKEC
jgi:hypothetical protein